MEYEFIIFKSDLDQWIKNKSILLLRKLIIYFKYIKILITSKWIKHLYKNKNQNIKGKHLKSHGGKICDKLGH
jgi:hypothetical protein